MLFRRRELGLLLFTLSVSLAQQFISEPSDTTAYVGKDVTLNCVLNSKHGSHLWVKDSVLITQEYSTLSHIADETEDSTRYERYTVVRSDIAGYYGYSLRISNVQLQDAGVYQCIVLGGTENLESYKATLEVFSAPIEEYPACTTSTDGLEVSVGEEVTFSCQSNGGFPATVLKWLRDGDLTEPSENTNSHSWTVTEHDDHATFICEGEHVLWSEPRTCSIGPFRLNTGEPAVKLSGLNEFAVKSTATFVCSAKHISTPQYSWYIDGTEVEPGNDRITFSNSIEYNAIMEIHDISFADAGMNVQCKITYFGGTLTSELHVVQVFSEPTTPPEKVPGVSLPDIEEEFIDPNDSGVSKSAIVGASMGIVVLVLLILIIVGIVMIRRAAKEMKGQDENGENFTMRSRYVGVLRSWFFPVHEHTQKSMTSFIAGPAMDNKAFQT